MGQVLHSVYLVMPTKLLQIPVMPMLMEEAAVEAIGVVQGDMVQEEQVDRLIFLGIPVVLL